MYNLGFSVQREAKMYNKLAYEERFYIETALKNKHSIEEIAKALNRTIQRFDKKFSVIEQKKGITLLGTPSNSSASDKKRNLAKQKSHPNCGKQ